MKQFYHLLLLLAGLLLCACEKDNPLVTAISLDRQELEIFVGETYQFELSYVDPDAPAPACQWEIEGGGGYRPSTLAILSNDGLLTAMKEGEFIVKVSTTEIVESGGSPLIATCRVKIKPVAASGIKLDKTAVSLKSSETAQLSFEISPENTTNKEVVWKSSDEKVATVSPLGVVKAVSVGKATITVCAKETPTVAATCQVTVEAMPLSGISLDINELTKNPGFSKQLTVIFQPENATNKNVIWKSSDENIATVDQNGWVTLKSTGKCEISATSEEGGFTAACRITVNKVDISTIMFLDNLTEISTGDSKKLRYLVLPSGAVEEGLIWTSSNESIATVENGIVTGHIPGIATIQVRDEKGTFSENTRVQIISAIQKNIDVSIELKPKPGYGPYAETDFICWIDNKNREEVCLERVLFYTQAGSIRNFWWNFSIAGGKKNGVQEVLPYVPNGTKADIYISCGREGYVFTVDVIFPQD